MCRLWAEQGWPAQSEYTYLTVNFIVDGLLHAAKGVHVLDLHLGAESFLAVRSD